LARIIASAANTRCSSQRLSRNGRAAPWRANLIDGSRERTRALDNTADMTRTPMKTPQRKRGTSSPKAGATVQERLRNHFRRLSDDILADLDDSLHSGTSEAVADSRESFISEIVCRIFPRTYRIAKGAIYDSFGGRSKSIDCVVCAPNHPLFLDSLGRVTTLLADAVQCAIEVKPDITDCPEEFGKARKQQPELVRGLEQVRSVKRLQRVDSALFWGYPPKKPSKAYDDYSRRVPTYLLSLRAPRMVDLSRYIFDYYQHNNVPLEEQLDLLVVPHNGLIVNDKYPEMMNWPNRAEWQSRILAFEMGADALAAFLLWAAAEVKPELMWGSPVLTKYGDIVSWPAPVAAWPPEATAG